MSHAPNVEVTSLDSQHAIQQVYQKTPAYNLQLAQLSHGFYKYNALFLLDNLHLYKYNKHQKHPLKK